MIRLPYLLPIIFNSLALITPTSHDISKYILINVGGWDYKILSTNQILYGVTGSVLFILVLKCLVESKYNITLLLAAITRAAERALSMYLLICGYLPFWQVFILRFIQTTVEMLSDSLLTSSIQGRLYDIIPEGFESTGVALTHVFSIFKLVSYQLDIY